MSQEIIITGTVKKIKEVEEFANDFTKQQIVVSTDEQYPQDLPIDFIKDKIGKLDSINIGDKVEVKVNLRGSEYNEKHYSSLNGWYLKLIEKASY
jgi:hypothetical protein